VYIPRIVGVKFQDKLHPDEFTGKEYNYFVADGLDLKVGDIVPVATKNGPGIAKVTRIDVKESQIDIRVKPYMRTIEEKPVMLQEVH
jgi:hypothetical protein